MTSLNIMSAYVMLGQVVLDDCKLFRDVAQSRSVSKGAALNGISQSAASQQIQELEDRFGIELLDRSTRPLGLTPAGRLYFELCREVLRQSRGVRLRARRVEARDRRDGADCFDLFHWALGDAASARGVCTPLSQGTMRTEFLRPDRVYEAVLTDAADLGLISYPEHRREITVIPWRDESMAVALPPGHRSSGESQVCRQDIWKGRNSLPSMKR